MEGEVGDPRRRRKVLPYAQIAVALPQPSVYLIAYPGKEGIEYDITFARSEQEAQEARPTVLATRLVISGDDPKAGMSVQFLNSVRDHGGLDVLLSLLTAEIAKFALELNDSSASVSLRAAD